jgi:hypothetical protein
VASGLPISQARASLNARRSGLPTTHELTNVRLAPPSSPPRAMIPTQQGFWKHRNQWLISPYPQVSHIRISQWKRHSR